MEDASFPSNTNLDFGIMDDLLLGGCWLESMNCSYHVQEGAESSGQSNSYLAEEGRNLDGGGMINPSSELSRRWWIQSRPNPGAAASVRERLVHVLNHIKESTKDGDVLIQIWAPIKKGGRKVLTTCGQPFSLNPHCQRLVNYRMVSTNYLFSVEEYSDMGAGLPGRVFLGRLPEWTPDVRYFSSEEYLRVDYARHCDIQGSLVLPFFERGSQACLGVVEVVMTTQKINYHPDLENICSALQAVDLRTSEVLTIPHLEASNTSYQVVLPEILEIMRAVCETHQLPLAQTWVPCIQQGKKGSRHTDENYADCVSTVDAACFVANPHFRGFHDACSEHHLFRGQGVVGKAFATNQLCFSMDITALSKAEYPLSHHARMFGLRAAVAIHLRSIYTRTTDYVLEFFLPVDCRNNEEQKLMLNSLSVIIKRCCRSLRVVTGKELDNETDFSINEVVPSRVVTEKELGNETDFSINEVVPSAELLVKPIPAGRPNNNKMSEVGFDPSIGTSGEKSLWTPSFNEAQQKGKNILHPAPVPMEFQKQGSKDFNVTGHWDNPELVFHPRRILSKSKQHQQGLCEENVEGDDSSFGKPNIESTANAVERRRIKTEKTVSLQVLRQYFAGSLKAAAKSIGVCPTTLKRICRQHGITRWPSRKIKKVGNSLRKLQVVIDSVQGAEGVVKISSVYANLPKTYGSDFPSQKLSRSDMLSTLEQTGHPKSSTTQPKGVFSIGAPLENSQTSSCSQISSSSLSCSTAVQSQHHATELFGSKDASKAESRSCMLKRACSEAELHALSKREETRPPSRSHSHKSLCKRPSLGSSSSLCESINLPQVCNSVRLKVAYGEEKVRFRLQPSWGFQDLMLEIASRFNIDDANAIDLKYLDDDSEWVMLTCDADLQDCKDSCKSSRMHLIKLIVDFVSQPDTRNSLGITALA